jgi:hypothetical protein
MEIFIIGGIIVALMVLVSTRIKKSAAAAFEPEFIEKEDFTVEKPEGFLFPLREPPDFPFEAYSKQYGERSTRNIWRARARLRIHEGAVLDELIEEAEDSETITSRELRASPPSRRELNSRSEKTEDEIDYAVYRRIVECADRGKTYEFRATMLGNHEEEYAARVREMLASLRIR